MRISFLARRLTQILKDVGFQMFVKYVDSPKPNPKPVQAPSNVELYEELQEKLLRVRIANDFMESSEEDDVLDDMETLWHTLSLEDQIAINDAPLRQIKFPK